MDCRQVWHYCGLAAAGKLGCRWHVVWPQHSTVTKFLIFRIIIAHLINLPVKNWLVIMYQTHYYGKWLMILMALKKAEEKPCQNLALANSYHI